MREEPLIRNVSDTALWVAVYRAEESERPDALFNDPFARRLAGERGFLFVASHRALARNSWPLVARTWLGDRMIEDVLRSGCDMVVNLAAGLDTRPFRMNLPKDLHWVEVDLPGILDYKASVLGDAQPVCRLERIPCDLADKASREQLFADLGRRASKALVIAEGLLIYLESDEVAALARDLSSVRPFERWLMDLSSPRVLQYLKRSYGVHLERAPMKFAPKEGPHFFEPLGWSLVDSRSLFKNAAKLNRLPLWMKLLSYLPEPARPWETRAPWSAMCLFERAR